MYVISRFSVELRPLIELQPLITYYNDLMWLSRTVPHCIYAISSSDMTDGDSLGQCVCRLWYVGTSQVSRGNIWPPTQTVYRYPTHIWYLYMSHAVAQSEMSGFRGEQIFILTNIAVGGVSDP